MQTFIGIDSGKQGAVTVVTPQSHGSDLVEITDTPMSGDEYDLVAMAHLLRPFSGRQVMVAVEKPMAMPNQSSPATLSQGMGFGIWLGILGALQLPFELVIPQRWRKVMLAGLPKGEGETPEARKKRLKMVSVQQAQRLAPRYSHLFVGPKGGLKDGRAESYLMACYLQRRP